MQLRSQVPRDAGVRTDEAVMKPSKQVPKLSQNTTPSPPPPPVTTTAVTRQDLRDLLRRTGRVLGTPPAFFLDPKRQRYIVISVDPAGGGALSDEAMVVFLVADDQFGLLTGRVVPSSNSRYGMAMVPLVFALSLLHTVRQLHDWLKRVTPFPGPFTLPPVLVLIENNYAYGAATYMQMLWLIDRQCQHPSWKGVQIIFATPVYGMNEWLVKKYDARKEVKDRLAQARTDQVVADRALRAAWENKGQKKKQGMNFGAFLKTIRQQAEAMVQQRAGGGGLVDVVDIEKGANVVIDELIARVRATGATVTQGDRAAVLNEWLDQRRAPAVDEHGRPRLNVQQMVTALLGHINAVKADQLLLTKLNKEIKEHLDRPENAAGGGPHDYVRVASWAALDPRHQIDLTTGAVSFPENAYENANKTIFGETTTQQDKVLAYHQFARMLRPGPGEEDEWQMLVLARSRAELERPDVLDNPQVACDATRHHDSDKVQLVGAVTLLSCVYQQWSDLVLRTGPDGKQRVEGKQQSDQPGQPRKKDDLWMAFSIGMRWCWRFARILADNSERRLLVDYMLRLRTTAQKALDANLQDATHRDAAHPGPDDDQVVAPKGSTRTQPPGGGGGDLITAVRPATPHPDRMATVVITASANATARVLAWCGTFLRRLFVAYALHGYDMDLGYALESGRMRLGASHAAQQRRWQERCLRMILEQRGGGDGRVPLDRIRATFGTVSHTVRFVCGTKPGPRFGWPMALPPANVASGPAAGKQAKKRRHGVVEPHVGILEEHEEEEEEDGTDAIGPHLQGLLKVIDHLRVLMPGVQATHGRRHPILNRVETEHLLEWLLHRIRGHLQDVIRVWETSVPPPVKRDCARQPLVRLNERLVAMKATGHGRSRGEVSRVPQILLAAYGQMSDDGRFLRRLVAFGRERIVGFVREDHHSGTSTAFDCAVSGAPDVSCRVMSRPHMNWVHAFRSLFPERYRALRADDERSHDNDAGASRYTYQSRVVWRPTAVGGSWVSLSPNSKRDAHGAARVQHDG